MNLSSVSSPLDLKCPKQRLIEESWGAGRGLVVARVREKGWAGSPDVRAIGIKMAS